ncbi:MgtC/SapB family protein [Azohydromonas australica]|uniref:MgtC/SapB family protein n=1 Tax=Azohydromonas australica TaxID=364039 RepID=UPI00040906B0|nr:MgtC/SapB family protein [Azohydromonas australica]
MLPSFDWETVLRVSAQLLLAYVLSLPIAFEREKAARSAGLRTFPLVAMASCGYMLFAEGLFEDSPEAQSRLVQGLMTGIGFIGGGAILKSGATVHGTATAASIWNTGAVAAAVAYGRYEIAVVLSAMNYLTLRVLGHFKYEQEAQRNDKGS